MYVQFSTSFLVLHLKINGAREYLLNQNSKAPTNLQILNTNKTHKIQSLN